MRLTSVDINNKEFSKSMVGGYSPYQVDEFLDQIADDYDELYKENLVLKEKLAANEERLEHYAKIENTIQNTLMMATNSADQVKSTAQKEAELIIRKANEEAKRVVEKAHKDLVFVNEDYGKLKQEFIKYRSRFKSFMKIQLDTFQDLENELVKNFDMEPVITSKISMPEFNEKVLQIPEEEKSTPPQNDNNSYSGFGSFQSANQETVVPMNDTTSFTGFSSGQNVNPINDFKQQNNMGYGNMQNPIDIQKTNIQNQQAQSYPNVQNINELKKQQNVQNINDPFKINTTQSQGMNFGNVQNIPEPPKVNIPTEINVPQNTNVPREINVPKEINIPKDNVQNIPFNMSNNLNQNIEELNKISQFDPNKMEQTINTGFQQNTANQNPFAQNVFTQNKQSQTEFKASNIDNNMNVNNFPNNNQIQNAFGIEQDKNKNPFELKIESPFGEPFVEKPINDFKEFLEPNFQNANQINQINQMNQGNMSNQGFTFPNQPMQNSEPELNLNIFDKMQNNDGFNDDDDDFAEIKNFFANDK